MSIEACLVAHNARSCGRLSRASLLLLAGAA